nr:hypothetical protein [Psychroflexus gondwanensis]
MHVADPANGSLSYTYAEFYKQEEHKSNKKGFSFLYPYLKLYKK